MAHDEEIRRFVDGEMDVQQRTQLLARATQDHALSVALLQAQELRAALSRLSEAQAMSANQEPPKDQLQRIMQRAVASRRAQEESPWRLLRSLWVPRFRVSAGGLLLAMLSVVVVMVSVVTWNRASDAPMQQIVERVPAATPDVSDRAAVVPVRFMLAAAGAKTVSVAGDFNRWQTEVALLDDSDGDGVFATTLLLPRGSYGYMFVIDGERWEVDPHATNTRDDGFGQRNAVIRVN